MSQNLRQNGRKVQTLSPFHNIKGGKMAHLDSCVASFMTLAGMGVCRSILFNPRLRFRTKYMYLENCDPLTPPPPPPPPSTSNQGILTGFGFCATSPLI